MFKSALWRNEKNKVKVEFKLQFHAAKLPQVGEDALVISVVPGDSGKPTVRSDKAVVRDGSCIWENPVYELVKFNRDPKSGKIHERIYYFVVGAGSSKSGVVGEASIDFANYAEVTKISLVSLPLKYSQAEATLHVSIQRMQEPHDLSEVGDNEYAKLIYKEHSLKAQFSNSDIVENIKSNSQDLGLKNASQTPELNINCRASSGSDVTMSSSESSTGVEIPWQPQVKNDSFCQDPGLVSPLILQGPLSGTQTPLSEERQRSQWEWLGNSALDVSTDDSSSTPRGAFPRQNSEERSDIVIEKLRSDVTALSRQAEMSELELRTLRKQVVKEGKRSQDLSRELACLKKERDVLREECEKLRSLQRYVEDTKTKTDLHIEGGDSELNVEELRRELNLAKDLNSTLQTQLRKIEESNSELTLAVRDLEEMLEQKKREISTLSSSMAKDSGDEEQKALEDLVNEHKDAKESYRLEQQIMDMRSEIEIFKRDKDELEMQLEQLALDYEIMKQENHDMACQLEQSQIQEQLKIQYECSPAYANVQELEAQIENLEKKLKTQSKESAYSLVRISEFEARVQTLEEELKKQSEVYEADLEVLKHSKAEQENELVRQSKKFENALARISELEAHAKSLEEELEKQSQAFEADLEALTHSKVEQEQKAITAEEALRKTRLQNANTAEKLQEEFRRLSVQMGSTFAANEKLATKALAEANELRLQRKHLEEMIQKTSDEHQLMKRKYEARLHQLASQVLLMTDQIERLQSEIEEKVLQLELQEKDAEETQRNLSNEIFKLRDEIETYTPKIKTLSEEIESKETLMEQMRISLKEMKLAVQQGNNERTELENKIMLGKTEAEEWQKELNKVRCHAKEKESMAGNLKSELDHLYSQFTESKHSIVENELEKETLREKLFLLECNPEREQDEFSSMETKIINGNNRGAVQDTWEQAPEHRVFVSCGSNEFRDLERKKLVEVQLTALEVGAGEHECAASSQKCGEDSANQNISSINELNGEIALLKETNASIAEELKEMQERYSKLSLKFAEVEGEKQQLSMKVRYLKSVKKRSSS